MERKGSKKVAKEGILWVSTKQKRNEKVVKMWQKGEKEGTFGVCTEQKGCKKGGRKRQKEGCGKKKPKRKQKGGKKRRRWSSQ